LVGADGPEFFLNLALLDWLKYGIQILKFLYKNEENSVCGNEENLFRE